MSRILDPLNRRHTVSLGADQDEEKSSGSISAQSLNELKLVYLTQLFHLPADVIAGYSGIDAYCKHLEGLFQSFHCPIYDPAWSEIQHRHPNKAITSCWGRLVAVMGAINGATEDDTIDSLWTKLRALRDAGGKPQEEGQCGSQYGLFIIFAVACWATASLQPIIPTSLDDRLEMACETDPYYTRDPPRSELSRCITRPVVPFFGPFKECIWESQSEASCLSMQNVDDENLYESSLNYDSLYEFGNIRIVWVDRVNEHLRFDPVNRYLLLFKFPSYCVLRSLRASQNKKRSVLESITAQLDPLASPGKPDNSRITLDQEIIMSYRLLFGMSRRSRTLALAELDRLEHDEGCIDSLLPVLCARKYYKERSLFRSNKGSKEIKSLPSHVWPASCLDAAGHLQESSIYSAKHDFPRFSQRLLHLQRFSLRQKPSKLTDLWRDRRNMVQWYTFWLVTIFGGTGLLLSFLQLVLAAMQVWRGWNQE